MAKLKRKEQHNKISGKKNSNTSCCSEQRPWFSFASMTRNSRYNLGNLPSGTEREQTLLGLHKRLVEITSNTWLYWGQLGKTKGWESMSYDSIHFEAAPDAVLPKDTTMYIFRFDTHRGAGKGRIIGYKQDPCAVFHVIGYDIDFSGYDHGN